MSSAAQQLSRITRTDLQRHDLGVPGGEVIHNRVDISAEAPTIRHKHSVTASEHERNRRRSS